MESTPRRACPSVRAPHFPSLFSRVFNASLTFLEITNIILIFIVWFFLKYGVSSQLYRFKFCPLMVGNVQAFSTDGEFQHDRHDTDNSYDQSTEDSYCPIYHGQSHFDGGISPAAFRNNVMGSLFEKGGSQWNGFEELMWFSFVCSLVGLVISALSISFYYRRSKVIVLLYIISNLVLAVMLSVLSHFILVHISTIQALPALTFLDKLNQALDPDTYGGTPVVSISHLPADADACDEWANGYDEDKVPWQLYGAFILTCITLFSVILSTILHSAYFATFPNEKKSDDAPTNVWGERIYNLFHQGTAIGSMGVRGLNSRARAGFHELQRVFKGRATPIRYKINDGQFWCELEAGTPTFQALRENIAQAHGCHVDNIGEIVRDGDTLILTDDNVSRIVHPSTIHVTVTDPTALE